MVKKEFNYKTFYFRHLQIKTQGLAHQAKKLGLIDPVLNPLV